MTEGVRYWAIIPAAGIGSRFQEERPKQYATLDGITVLEHSLRRLLSVEVIEGICVMLHPGDEHWSSLSVDDPRVDVATGGDERHISVFNGLEHLHSQARNMDWVLVHDAARPCVTEEEIRTLLRETAGHPVGGLLGTPVADTLKRIGRHHEVLETVDRQTLWAAQTPQVFRFGLLHSALQSAIDQGRPVTDEAMAIEREGYHPLMVAGRRQNIKITLPEDLALAAQFIQNGEY